MIVSDCESVVVSDSMCAGETVLCISVYFCVCESVCVSCVMYVSFWCIFLCVSIR